MLTILAFVGVICVLKYISKKLKRFGVWIESVSERMAEKSVSNTRMSYNSEKARVKITKTLEALNKIKSEDTYISEVRDEINRLT
jgi:hypothetical protein